MKRHQLFTLLLALFILNPLSAQTDFEWGLSLGSGNRDEVTDLAMDAMGNTYFIGTFEDSLDVIDGSGVEYVKSNGWRDIFLAKYSPSGDKLWAYAFGNLGWDRGWAMTVDDQGAAYMGGVFTRSVDFDPGPDSTILTSNTAGFWPDGYLAKYDTDGKLVWAKHLLTARDRAASQTATLLAITTMEIDGNGDLVIGGAFWDTVYLSPTKMLVSDGPLRDMFLAKYDSNGNLIWGQQMGGASDQQIQSLAIDNSGNIFTTGYYFGTPDFDPAGGGSTLSTIGAEDIFLAKYTATGALDWVKGFGSVNGANVTPEMGMDVGTDGMGNVYVTGRLLGEADFDLTSANGTITPMTSIATFTAKYDGQGAYQWAYTFDGPGFHRGKQLEVFANGDFFLAGEYGSSVPGIDLDPSADSAKITSLGGTADIFVAKYDANMAYQSSWMIRGLGDAKVEGLASNGKDVAVGGLYSSSMLFHQQSGDLRFSKGDFDMCVLRYGDGASGFGEELVEGNLKVFPNPTNGSFSIEANWPKPQTATIHLRNLQGQVLQTWENDFSKELKVSVEAEGLSAGFYLVELVLAKGRVVEKVVVR